MKDATPHCCSTMDIQQRGPKERREKGGKRGKQPKDEESDGEEEEKTLVAGVLSQGDDSEEEELLLPPNPGQTTVVARRSGGGKLFLVLLTFFSALGGFLFGYDTGVVSGAMIEVRRTFSLDSTWVELLVSATIAAAALAAFLAGPLCELLGRKPVLLAASVVFTAGAVIIAAAQAAWEFLVGRIVVGLGIGMAAMAVPMYIAELAPARMRGKLVTVNTAFITGGQCIAALIDGIFSLLPWNIGWRFMLGLAALPSIVMFLGFLFMPESPRWLVFSRGRVEKARAILRRVRPPGDVEEELQSIVLDYEEHKRTKMGLKTLITKFFTSRTVMLALLVGCGLQLFQQFGGINTVMYYSASIIQMAGFSDKDSIWLAVVPAFGNFAFTIVGVLLIDRVGRRKLLLGSTAGFVFGFLLLVATFVVVDVNSPGAVSAYSNHTCSYTSCGACVGNSRCGFCADFDVDSGEYLNGTCELGNVNTNGDDYSFFRPLASGDEGNSTAMAICGIYGEVINESTYAITDGVYLFDNTSWLDIDNSTLRREWFFNTCPDNRFAALAIVSLFVYIAFFAAGMGPLPWTINSEIYPTWARSMAIAIATSVNWISNLIVSMTFLTLADNLGQPSTFGLYAGLGLLGLVFFFFLVPETKGRKLEEVEELFQMPHFLTWCFSRKGGESQCSIM